MNKLISVKIDISVTTMYTNVLIPLSKDEDS